MNVFKIDTAKIVEVPEQLKEMPKEPTTIVKPKTKVVDVKVEEEKQTDAEYYEEVISSYETLKELEENEETIKYYDEVIESYKILLELV
jgi:dsDNA-specific endonuclease/ATPase MutS2